MLWFSNAVRGLRTGDWDKDGPRELLGKSGNRKRAARDRTCRLDCEDLEQRALLATAGYDYVLNGGSWPDPAVITWSIAPDGVAWSAGTNDLNAAFNSKFGTGVWEAQIARAFATWQAVTGIDFEEVSDGSYAYNTPGLSENDPRFGDIRIGGFTFSDDTTLALTDPPLVIAGSNAPTDGGDVSLNTGLNFNIGGTYDLYSVVLHEIGHAIGLGEAPNPAEVMYTQYEGVRNGLEPGDIAGAQTLYGTRMPDVFQAQGLATSMTAAANLSSSITSTSQTLSSLSIDSVGDEEYFELTAPSWSGSVLQVTANAASSSMLSPTVLLYNSNGQLIAQQTGNPSAWDSSVTASFSGVVPGATYFVVVSASSGTVYNTGNYQLTVSLPNGSPPISVTPPSSGGSTGTPSPTPTPTPSPTPTPTPSPTPPPGNPPKNDSINSAQWLGAITKYDVTGGAIGPDDNSDFFSFRAARSTIDQIAAAGLTITVFNGKGRQVAAGTGVVNVKLTRGTLDTVEISAGDGQTVASYTLSIGPRATTQAARLSRLLAARSAQHAVLAARHLLVTPAPANVTRTALKTSAAVVPAHTPVQPGSAHVEATSIGPVDTADRARKHLKH